MTDDPKRNGALCLGRVVGESITVGDGVTFPKFTIYIMAVNGNQVKLRLEGPKVVPIVRTELFGRKT